MSHCSQSLDGDPNPTPICPVKCTGTRGHFRVTMTPFSSRYRSTVIPSLSFGGPQVGRHDCLLSPIDGDLLLLLWERTGFTKYLSSQTDGVPVSLQLFFFFVKTLGPWVLDRFTPTWFCWFSGVGEGRNRKVVYWLLSSYVIFFLFSYRSGKSPSSSVPKNLDSFVPLFMRSWNPKC